MSTRKERLTVTIDPDLVLAGNESVRRGDAPSLSAWVNTALRERVAQEARRAALREAIAAYEAEHGEISDAEIEAQRRADRRRAIVVSGRRGVPSRRKRRAA